jgi:anti-sigma factor RsiW
MSGVDCDRVRDLLPDYAQGRLAPVQANQVKRHVAQCDDCTVELAVLDVLGAGAVVPPPDLARRVEIALDAELAGASPGAPEIRLRRARRPWWRSFWTPAAVLATAAAAFMVTRAVDTASKDPLDSAATLVARDTAVVAPYGDWPGADGEVAGLAMLDDLSAQQLQTLLDRMER